MLNKKFTFQMLLLIFFMYGIIAHVWLTNGFKSAILTYACFSPLISWCALLILDNAIEE